MGPHVTMYQACCGYKEASAAADCSGSMKASNLRATISYMSTIAPKGRGQGSTYLTARQQACSLSYRSAPEQQLLAMTHMCEDPKSQVGENTCPCRASCMEHHQLLLQRASLAGARCRTHPYHVEPFLPPHVQIRNCVPSGVLREQEGSFSPALVGDVVLVYAALHSRELARSHVGHAGGRVADAVVQREHRQGDCSAPHVKGFETNPSFK